MCHSVLLKKVKVQVYSLISSISSDFLHFYSLVTGLFIRVRSQLNREHTVLQPFRRIELIIHIAISVLPGTHFYLSRVKHFMVKCLGQGHNIETMSQYWEGRNMIFLWKSCTKRDLKPHGMQRHWQSSALQPLCHVPLCWQIIALLSIELLPPLLNPSQVVLELDKIFNTWHYSVYLLDSHQQITSTEKTIKLHCTMVLDKAQPFITTGCFRWHRNSIQRCMLPLIP